MTTTIKHPDLATMTVRSERVRELAIEAGVDAALADGNGATTAITHYPDGRIEVHADGDAQALADAINAAGSWPNNVVPADNN